MKDLDYLEISSCKNLTLVDSLKQVEIKELCLQFIPELIDITPIRSVKRLKLVLCPKVTMEMLEQLECEYLETILIK